MSTKLPDNPVLPIFCPPCYMCKHFKPRLVTDSFGNPFKIRMCASLDMRDDFCCLEKTFPFNAMTIKEVLVNPRYIDIRPEGEVNTVQRQSLIKAGWNPLKSGWWRKCTTS